MKAAVLGTGVMGAGMARSLLRDGVEVTVWNRTPQRARPLAADGARIAASAEEAVRDADAVLIAVYDAQAVLAVLGDALAASPEDAVWVQTATIGPEGTRQAAELAAGAGRTLVEAMLLGTRQPAETGRLTLLTAGDPAVFARIEPVTAAVSVKSVWTGPEVGAGTALKLACNAWIASITAAAAQSLALAGSLGLDPKLFLAAIEGAPADCAYAHAKGEGMLAGAYESQFALDAALKDVDLIDGAARDAGVDTTLLGALRALYGKASEAGHGGEDLAAVYTSFGGARGGKD
ncbi:NAD(P)-dependent oxidoreductase [Streptomyces sp. WMMC500]|uniref:NAD(P)-dependent oxidoreductase n=1 Tax=Streptomyces sp. WMMC500 TaxID=3015154 RepID=UPI00248CA21A|nr:NAD(P)-dependent oxidoreductase [Streptomyces sp. WMMC500]WBB61097.1 NAD(P)-dependent oxidoreductase [Streptomyces sp. WMMC500]